MSPEAGASDTFWIPQCKTPLASDTENIWTKLYYGLAAVGNMGRADDDNAILELWEACESNVP